MEAFEMLSTKDREILRLMLIEGFTTAEAADRLGLGLWSVYKRYERALQRIRKLVE
jgi:DNA-directed RNA polymerase specialized sigma24 family protein